jgi:selenide,water dikinase
VGLERSDDAGVFRLRKDLAIVQTVDFVTPIVDDPYTFGRIAAANSLSDVYAMGGRPVTVLNIAAFPKKDLSIEVLKEIFRGGLETVLEAEATLVGGHTLDDPELKYGLCVTGVVHPDHVITNAGAKAGDAIVLTKPIGTGIIATAVKKNKASREDEEAIIMSMICLNRIASEEALAAGMNACTDVTGFGLIGHASEMAAASGVGIEIEARKVPLFHNTLDYAAGKMIPGGGVANKTFYSPRVRKTDALDEVLYDVLNDPQTSGGLLIALPREKADQLVSALNERGLEHAVVIGKCTSECGIVSVTV